MRIAKIIFLVLGILLILLNVFAYFGGVSPFLSDPTVGMPEKIGYFIGSNLFMLVGFIFLLIARRFHKKLNKKKDQQLVDSLFTDQHEPK